MARIAVSVATCLVFAVLPGCTSVGVHDKAAWQRLDFGAADSVALCLYLDEGIDEERARGLVEDAWRDDAPLYRLEMKITGVTLWRRPAFTMDGIIDALRHEPLTPGCDRILALIGRHFGDVVWGFLLPEYLGDLHVTAIGLNGLYRFPLARDGDFPHGRLQPYAGVGLGAFIAHLETRTTVLDVNIDFGDTDVRVGVQALAGARFFLTPHLALFGEYKFVHTDDLKFNLVSDPGTRGGLTTGEVNKLQFGLTTHMLQPGIAYHW